MPLSNAFLKDSDVCSTEAVYPLDVFLCEKCFLAQLPVFQAPDKIFSDYAYFSSYSQYWLEHIRSYVEDVTRRFSFLPGSRVIEVASNDGYLLQFFNRKVFEVLGIEPAANVALCAREKGIPTEIEFFGVSLAEKLVQKNKKADLIIGNNVLAHVPELNNFLEGMRILLKDSGIITMEFPHLFRLVEQVQFDTIYHEHFSYFSFFTVKEAFEKHRLEVFDVEEIPTHGGSLRVFVQHEGRGVHPVRPYVSVLLRKEEEAGMQTLDYYQHFQKEVCRVKNEVVSFLRWAGQQRKTIAGYGAAAKGNTLLNYCQVSARDIVFIADRNPYKQGRYMPGSHIPIVSPDEIIAEKPDYIFILPWNIKEEIMDQLHYIREWKAQFVVPIPVLEIIP